MRERWVKNADGLGHRRAPLARPATASSLTARGQVFVAPAQQGRLVEATRNKRVRYREGRGSCPTASRCSRCRMRAARSSSGSVPANGVGAADAADDATARCCAGTASRRPTASTSRTTTRTSSSGCYDVANEEADEDRRRAANGDFDDLRWSPDSQWLAYTAPDANQLTRIYLYERRDRHDRRR